ncbi:MAG: S8 family peptidase [Gemmatimonadaceae bacterium]
MVRRSISPLVAVTILTVGVACADPAGIAPTAARGPVASTAPGRYLVQFDGPAEVGANVLAASGGTVVDSIPSMNVLVVDGVTNPDALRLANPKYIEAGFVATIDPIKVEETVSTNADAVPGQQNTPWYASNVLWGMHDIHAEDGWATTNGGQGVNACIVDTGIDSLHQELSPRVIKRANFVVGETRFDDPNGHGSHVSGTLAGTGVVISGVAPRANLLGARVLSAAGSGFESAIINGINWCVQNGAHVINMSLGGIRYTGSASYSNSLKIYGEAIKNANDAGVVVVTAAGNDGLQLPNPALINVPSQVPGTIIVGATGPVTRSTAPLPPNWDPFDPSQVWRSPDYKSYYSNFGTTINVFAPGGSGGVPLNDVYRFVDRVAQGGPNDQVWSVCSSQTAQTGAVNSGGVPSGSGSCLGVDNRYIEYAGTSMATPHVAGMAAVLYDALGGVRSATNRARVESCIENTTDDIGPSSVYGSGRINVKKALAALRAGTC